MASPSSYADRPPLQGFRRSFTAPHRQLSVHDRAALSDADAGAETIFTHPSVRIISFAPPPESIISKSNQTAGHYADYPIDTVETLPWRSRTEDLVASGKLIIEKVRGSVRFLKCGSHFAFAILRNSQCWCVDGESKFVWRKGQFQYYRLELPTSTQEEQAKVEELKAAFGKVLMFEKTPCPFKRGFHVDLPDDAITPRRKGKWKPKEGSLPNTPDTDTPLLRRTKDSRSWSLQGQSPVPVPESRRPSDMGFAKRLYPVGARRETTPGVRPSTPSSTASSEEAISYGQAGYSDGASSVDEHESVNGEEQHSQGRPSSSETDESAAMPGISDETEELPVVDADIPIESQSLLREIEAEAPPEETIPAPETASDDDIEASPDLERDPAVSPEENAPLVALVAPEQRHKDEDNTKISPNELAQPPTAEYTTEATPAEDEVGDHCKDVYAAETGELSITEHTLQVQEEPKIHQHPENSTGDEETIDSSLAGNNVDDGLSQQQDLAKPQEPEPSVGNEDDIIQQGEIDSSPDPNSLLEDVPVASEAVSEVAVQDEPLDDTASIVSTADSFHTLASEYSAYPQSQPEVDLLKMPDSPSTARVQHKRGVSEMTITASNFDEHMEENEADRPDTPRLIKSSASDHSWPDVQMPANVHDGLRQRLKTRRSLSPLPSSSTVFVPTASNHNNHMTSVLLQKACNLALVKPIEVVVLVVHILARIAGGASLNDLLTGELFKRPDQHRRNSSFPDRLSPHQDDDEDDFGVPIRGRTRSTETTTSQARDTDTDSLFDLD